MRVGDDAELTVHRAVVEVEEALGLALAHHIAGLRVGAADLGLLDLRLTRLWLERLPAVGGAVLSTAASSASQ